MCILRLQGHGHVTTPLPEPYSHDSPENDCNNRYKFQINSTYKLNPI